MTIGKKFLDRVLTEAKSKDADGFKDDFDITTLSATSPAVANLTMPMARQVVQLYHLLGVSAETLEMRPKAVKEAALTVADEMRTNRPLRLAAQRLFTALATAKGFARKEEEVMEASASMAPQKDTQLIGNTIVKQMEALLAALKLPAGVLQRAMRRDQQSMMDTAAIIRTGAARSKFAMLASELGVDLMGVGQSVKVEEAATSDAVDAGHKRVLFKLEKHCGKPVEQCTKAELRKAFSAMLDADEIEPDDIGPVLDLSRRLQAQLKEANGALGTVPTTAVQQKSGIEAFHAAASALIAELGLNVSALPNAKMLDRKMMIAQRGDAFNTRAIRAMNTLTAILKGNNR